MRRYFKSRATHSVSLFPFLAVLICTFGVLIVLLVLVVKAADHRAETKKQDVDQQNEAEQNELQLAVEYQELRIEGLSSIRPDLLSKLHQARAQRAYLQTSIDSLKYEVDQVNDQIRLISNEAEIASSKPDDGELKRLESELEQEWANLENRRRNAAVGRPTRYSIVPHDGPDGTSRRPIYIECLSDRLIIRPYGIELTKKDFVRPIVANNPLDAALLAVREYFLKNKLNEAGQTPYPLLIVRPQGAESYSVARHAIRSWDEEFGYELIAAEKELEFGPADPQLKRNIIQAVEAARRRQKEYVAAKLLNSSQNQNSELAAGGRFGSTVVTRVGLQASSRHGGFVGTDGRLAESESRHAESENDFLASEPNPNGNTESISAQGDNGDAANSASAMASIAQSRGANWALPKDATGATGYRRPVVIHVSQYRIVVLNSSDATRNVPIAWNQSKAAAAEQVVAEVWKQVEGWGVAGANSYWKPELIVKVLPGGMQRYNELVQLMRGSGMGIREAAQ